MSAQEAAIIGAESADEKDSEVHAASTIVGEEENVIIEVNGQESEKMQQLDVENEGECSRSENQRGKKYIDPITSSPNAPHESNQNGGSFSFFGKIASMSTDKKTHNHFQCFQNVRTQEVFHRGMAVTVSIDNQKKKAVFLQAEVVFKDGVVLLNESVAVTCETGSHCEMHSLSLLTLRKGFDYLYLVSFIFSFYCMLVITYNYCILSR
jgi:hypothetical protein